MHIPQGFIFRRSLLLLSYSFLAFSFHVHVIVESDHRFWFSKVGWYKHCNCSVDNACLDDALWLNPAWRHKYSAPSVSTPNYSFSKVLRAVKTHHAPPLWRNWLYTRKSIVVPFLFRRLPCNSPEKRIVWSILTKTKSKKFHKRRRSANDLHDQSRRLPRKLEKTSPEWLDAMRTEEKENSDPELW